MTALIAPLDASNAEDLRAWHECYYASHMFGRKIGTPWMLEEVRADFLADNPGERNLGFRATVDGEVIGVGSLGLPLKDNLHLAWVDVNTHPAHRGRGYGSAMLEHLTEVCRSQGRRTVTAEAAFPYDGPPDGAGHPYVDFLLHRGFTLGLGDVMRVLDLPADEALLREIVDEASPHHEDYEIRQFVGPVPEDIIDSFGELVGSLVTEAPMGELELEAEVLDTERIRADEKVFQESGRTKYTTVAIAKDGTVAAYSELVLPEHDPGRVYQWGTLARRDHRGHRLGLATKARNLLWLQGARRDGRLLVTYNAEVNRHMIGVNDRMGFRPAERLGEFQRKLD